MIASTDQAFELLKSLCAPRRLLVHAQLVVEAAQEITHTCHTLNIPVDGGLIEIGACIHDAGKIIHKNELEAPGNLHEEEGEKLMLENGASPTQARCCVSHARFFEMEVSVEELAIALADKLWKGKRVVDLELRFIEVAAELAGVDRWDIYHELDGCFERIAMQGDNRLLRSRVD